MLHRFAGFLFDDERGLEGPSGPIPLRPLDSKFLRLLLGAEGRIVSRDAIHEAVWKGKIVSDDSITQAVRRLRSALTGPDGTEIIQTVYGRGVRIGVQVERSFGREAGTDSVAQSVARNIQVAAYLTSARELAARRSPGDIAAAIEAAQKAIDVLPTSVEAWTTLADFRLFQAGRMLAVPREAGAAAVNAANRALELDPSCASALAIRGWVKAVIDRQVASGLADLEASLRISDQHWFTRGLHAWALTAAGRVTDAASEMQACTDLNPWGAWSAGMLGWYRLLAGEPDVALAEVRSAVIRHPGIEVAHQQRSMVASALELHDEAIESGRRAVELSPGMPLIHAAYASALARGGQRAEAQVAIRAVESSELSSASAWLASAHLALGRKDLAIRVLERAAAVGAPQLVFGFVDPRLAELRGVPAFERLRPGTG